MSGRPFSRLLPEGVRDKRDMQGITLLVQLIAAAPRDEPEPFRPAHVGFGSKAEVSRLLDHSPEGLASRAIALCLTVLASHTSPIEGLAHVLYSDASHLGPIAHDAAGDPMRLYRVIHRVTEGVRMLRPAWLAHGLAARSYHGRDLALQLVHNHGRNKPPLAVACGLP